MCQISSTLYNALIRAELEITDSTHHSISSNYIPFGLDATISSPNGPDLKVKNTYDTPIYIISYTNPMDKNVTVEVYGKPVVNVQFGDVILDYSFKDLGTFGNPGMNNIWNWGSKPTPDDKILGPGESHVYAEARVGQKVQTYIHYLSLDGEELLKENFHAYTWNPKAGTTYNYDPDPSTLPPPSLTPLPSLPPLPDQNEALP